MLKTSLPFKEFTNFSQLNNSKIHRIKNVKFSKKMQYIYLNANM